jgi:predicted tellurium resistance membrane protein TerC
MIDFFSAEIISSIITLSLLEIVLGIDNLIFIALVVQHLPKEMAKKVRFIGLSLAMIIRVIMLLGITWVMSLTKPIFSMNEIDFSIKDLLLLAGGMFLIAKSTLEMHCDIAGKEKEQKQIKPKASFIGAVVQVALIDFIFSFDSIITAVGLTPHTGIIIGAIVISMIVMLLASGYITHFLKEHPTFKVLALSFILMIGILLTAEGMHFHIPRGYIYAAFAFSMFVETLNTLARMKSSKK